MPKGKVCQIVINLAVICDDYDHSFDINGMAIYNVSISNGKKSTNYTFPM